ncbi:MAG: N-acetylmuramoyl-L-alanine amidase [Alistipes sp.]|nr:N-acetylmuramoyl-L-alanine amidase [Alistipes sp.]
MRTPIFALLVLFAMLSGTGHVVAAEQSARGINVIVLDAGHGGTDPGAHYAGVYEKDITLKVVLRLGKLIEQEMPGVKVVYTRTTDKALAATKQDDLQARADIANKAGGDLFLSVHVNASHMTAARGVETLVMGESTKEQSYNEDALYENNRDDLIDMSDERTAAIVRAYIQNLQFTYGEYSLAMANCIQKNYAACGRHSRGVKPQLLRVLYATDMPGVLTEIGFLSNPREAAYLKSEKGINEIVQALFRSVKEYSARLSQLRGEIAGNGQPANAGQLVRPELPSPKSEQEPKPEAKPERTTHPEPTTAPVKKPAAQPQQRPVAEANGLVRYTVQLKASQTEIPLQSEQFKSYRNATKQLLGTGAYRYKYCVGEFETYAAAQRKLQEIRREFPDAFIVRYSGSRIVK